MARFRVNELSYVGFALAHPGTEVTLTRKDDAHHISENLSPVDDEAQAWVDSQSEPHPDKSKAKAEKPAKAPKADKAKEPAKTQEPAKAADGDNGEGKGQGDGEGLA